MHARRGPALGRRGGLMMAPAIDQSSPAATFSLDGGTSTSTTTCGCSVTTPRCSSSTRRTTRPRSWRRVAGRTVVAIVLHPRAQRPHQRGAARSRDATGAPVLAAPRRPDAVGRRPPRPRPDCRWPTATPSRSRARRCRCCTRPGHSPGGGLPLRPELGALFTGDTLFHGGPGATGRSFSDFPTIIDSIRSRLLTLPADTRVHTGHGDDDDHRRRGTALRRLGRPRPLTRPRSRCFMTNCR